MNTHTHTHTHSSHTQIYTVAMAPMSSPSTLLYRSTSWECTYTHTQWPRCSSSSSLYAHTHTHTHTHSPCSFALIFAHSAFILSCSISHPSLGSTFFSLFLLPSGPVCPLFTLLPKTFFSSSGLSPLVSLILSQL